MNNRPSTPLRVVRRIGSRLFFVALTVGTLANQASAQVSLPNTPTALELRVLPPECGPRLGLGPDAQAKYHMYEARYGRPIWDHYHHYCFALNFLNRQRVVIGDIPARRFDLSSAINNLDYLIAHWPPNSPQLRQAKLLRQITQIQLSGLH